jgi:hypothetical protein
MIHAKYTVVLKTLLDDPNSKAKIDQALANYPLYQPDHKYDMVPDREAINKRLLNHYKYREIGFDSFGRFLDELQITMDEIMPRYNELLKTVVIMADLPSPFDNVDVVESFEETRTEKGSSKTDATANDTTKTDSGVISDNKQVQSQTPQGQISIPASDINSIQYADQVNWGKDSSTSNGTSTSNGATSSTGSNESNGTTKHTFTKKGNQGVNTYAHDMLEFRTQIIDVVDQLINDPRIAELFMLVY